jgi:phenylalanyl-tRNA synthetase alpha chain
MNMSSLRELERIQHDALAAIEAARTAHDLDEVKRRYLGRKGILAQLFADVPKLSADQRRQVGERLNVLQNELTEKHRQKEAALRQQLQVAQTQAEALDVTLPGRRIQLGRRHVLTRTLEEMERIFFGMGFEVVEGTEVETDEFNFERLNMGRDHPARDAQDSFYLSDDLLLRTHTTVVDARVMVGRKPPMRILNSGRCYRRDAPDATHMPVFHQVDGFMVGEHITFADLRGVLASFVRQMFGPEAVYRFVPSYFPFTEPSAELLVWFGNRWLELAGSGMFHPRVLEMAGIDPTRYTAFAFGLGVDRPAMVRYGIPDIRYFWENDLRLLEQF